MAERWSPESSEKIYKRIVIQGELVLDAPTHFGNGESDGTELLLLEDALEQGPLLPGASIAGALRHYLVSREHGYGQAEKLGQSLAVQLFGEALDERAGEQSRVIVDDALGEGALLDIRDGVKITPETRTAEDKALYTFRVWSPGTRFKLRFELAIHAGDDEDHLMNGLGLALAGLEVGEISLGARKSRGYGQLHIEHWRTATFDLTTVAGLGAWLLNGGADLDEHNSETITTLTGYLAEDDQREFIRIEGVFALEDSLLIRAGSDVADMAHLMTISKGKKEGEVIQKPILSGTSLAGAIRARALKIMKTLSPSDEFAIGLIDDMFGAHGSSGENSASKENRQASRVQVRESEIKSAVHNLVQNRIKIDRFTGGAYETALFRQQPVFANDETQVSLSLELRIPSDDNQRFRVYAEAGLLLLLIKDLWTADLPIGGESSVGRGRLQGIQAELELQYKGHQRETILIEDHLGTLAVSNPSRLEDFVMDLHNYIQEEGQHGV